MQYFHDASCLLPMGDHLDMDSIGTHHRSLLPKELTTNDTLDKRSIVLFRPNPKSLSDRGSEFRVLGSGLPADMTSARLEHFLDVMAPLRANSPFFETPRPYS